jgi:hypothetical protein
MAGFVLLRLKLGVLGRLAICSVAGMQPLIRRPARREVHRIRPAPATLNIRKLFMEFVEFLEIAADRKRDICTR